MNRIQKADGFENQYLFVLNRQFLDKHQELPLFNSFRVTDIGYFPHAQYHFRERTGGCPEAILLVCVNGSGHYRLKGGETIPVGPGQCFVLPPGASHYYAANEDDPWSVYWLHFSGSDTLALCEMITRQQPLPIDGEHVGSLARIFLRCFEILKKPYQAEEYFAICQYARSALATVLLAGKQASLPRTEKGGQAVQDATAFMKANLHRNVTLAEIAAAANFSASHLHTLFRSITGNAPMEYYLRMKMQAAGKELYFTSRPVKEIAAQFGIYDSCYFSRAFKKVMGMAPLAYRGLKKG